MISAQVICDSISHQGKRLTTFKLRYPKFIHGEFMTHRLISRNASSSRAIPVKKLIAEVEDNATRAGPVWWGAEQKGMQSGGELSGEALEIVQSEWENAALNAASSAGFMARMGVHKSIVNRILEPFSHINVVASATEWDNFFGLRLDRAAQPEMRTLAEHMWQAREESEPLLLREGEWHLPFINKDHELYRKSGPPRDGEGDTSTMIKVSVARCARVSYESFETGRLSTVEEDLALYDKLVGAQPMHASPAEHQATPDTKACGDGCCWSNEHEWGNFVGWRQYRKMLPGEECAPLPREYIK